MNTTQAQAQGTGNRLSIVQPGTMPAPDADWMSWLQRDQAGQIKKNAWNVNHVLLKSEDWAGQVWTDTFRNRRVRTHHGVRGSNTPWKDMDSLELMEWLQCVLSCDVPRASVEDGISMAASKAMRNPLLEYLESLEWDGVDRMSTWLIDYMGAKDTRLSQAVGRAWMISAVARAYSPGCQADHCLILEGPQGLRKSTALRTLAGMEYFAEYSAASLTSKDAAILCSGIWIMEFSELGAVRANRSETVKSFVTRIADHYRPPYERYAVSVPRSCVFAGTTNEDQYFDDPTGNRRYWPIYCKYASIAALQRDRDQLWGEAVIAYKSQEPWHLNKDLERDAVAEQKIRLESDVWLEDVAAYVHDKRDNVSTVDVLIKKFGLNAADVNPVQQKRIAGCLRTLGWETYQTSDGKCLKRWRLPKKRGHKASLNPDHAMFD